MRIERARYEADLAERRYEAVDPANRLIAATLEQRWNDTLQTTTHRDRKRILRLLIRDVTVNKGPEPKIVRLHVRWQGGATETLELRRPPNRAEAIRYPDAFVGRIRDLAADHHDDDIVRLLAAEGRQGSTGTPLTPSMIQWLRYKHRILAPRPAKNTLNVRQVRERYGVSLWVVHYWIGRGLITAQLRKPNAPYAISIDDTSDRFLRDWVAHSGHLNPSSQTQPA